MFLKSQLFKVHQKLTCYMLVCVSYGIMHVGCLCMNVGMCVVPFDVSMMCIQEFDA